MKLIKITSDINNKIDLLIEHKKLNNSSHHLNYILTKINDKFYFIDARSDLVTIKGDLICPYCLQKLTITRTYTKANGTIVKFFVKHVSKNEMSEGCIFKHQSKGDYNSKVDDFYKSREFRNRRIILMLKEEIGNNFEISIPKEYKVLKEDGVSINFKYKKHKIVGVYPSNSDEFICRLKTEEKETLFCMLDNNNINIRNNYKETWSKHNVTVVTIDEYEPSINSDIEPKINIHSKFYTSCLYSKTQQQAYDEYLLEHEKYKKQAKALRLSIISKNVAIPKHKVVKEEFNEEVDKYNNRKTLEKMVDHELNRVEAYLKQKFGLSKINEDLWTTTNGNYHKLINIKVTKNDIYFYRQCPEIYLKHIDKFGYKIEVVK